MLRVQGLWSHILRSPQWGNPPSRFPSESYNRNRRSLSRASFDLFLPVTGKWFSQLLSLQREMRLLRVFFYISHWFPNRKIVQININSHFFLRDCGNGANPPSCSIRARMERDVSFDMLLVCVSQDHSRELSWWLPIFQSTRQKSPPPDSAVVPVWRVYPPSRAFFSFLFTQRKKSAILGA
jgi:hypothetical protein